MGLKSQALSNLLAQFLSKDDEPFCKDLPSEEVCMIDDYEWRIAFDGSSIHRGDGTGVMLYALR